MTTSVSLKRRKKPRESDRENAGRRRRRRSHTANAWRSHAPGETKIGSPQSVARLRLPDALSYNLGARVLVHRGRRVRRGVVPRRALSQPSCSWEGVSPREGFQAIFMSFDPTIMLPARRAAAAALAFQDAGRSNKRRVLSAVSEKMKNDGSMHF